VYQNIQYPVFYISESLNKTLKGETTLYLSLCISLLCTVFDYG